MQCVAVCCSVLHRVASCCSVLQCAAECGSVLQCVSHSSEAFARRVSRILRIVLQCVAVRCSAKGFGNPHAQYTRLPLRLQAQVREKQVHNHQHREVIGHQQHPCQQSQLCGHTRPRRRRRTWSTRGSRRRRPRCWAELRHRSGRRLDLIRSCLAGSARILQMLLGRLLVLVDPRFLLLFLFLLPLLLLAVCCRRRHQRYSALLGSLLASFGILLQCVAVCCSALQCVAVCCNRRHQSDFAPLGSTYA